MVALVFCLARNLTVSGVPGVPVPVMILVNRFRVDIRLESRIAVRSLAINCWRTHTGGSTFCAVASMHLMGRMDQLPMYGQGIVFPMGRLACLQR